MSDAPIKVKHIKRGTEYTVLGRAEVQSEFPINEGDILTVYQGADGKLWARPTGEFDDGRFVEVKSNIINHT
jgi:hypothetical protein